MAIWEILGILAALAAILPAAALIRAVTLKPTPAKTAAVLLDNQGERAAAYGKGLARMIRQETVSGRFQPDRTKFLQFHDTLEDLFPNVHRRCEKHVFDGSLLLRWKGRGTHAPILLMSHQDVVEAKGDWEHGAFSGDIDAEGRVWGRGAVDTKGSLFCIFTALEELIAGGFEPECDVYIASSCTEEWSGDGAPKTAEYLKEQGIMLELVIDEGGMILEEPIAGVRGIYGLVGVVEKGYGDVRFTAKGNGGHASTPPKNTPLVRLGKFMAEVDRKNPFRSAFSPAVRELFRRTAPNMRFGMRFLFGNLWLFGPVLAKLLPALNPAAGAMLRTTAAFTMAEGSDGFNVLPQEASVTANMRFIPHQPNGESLKLISGIAKKYQIDMEVIYQDEPCPTVDFHSPAFALVEEIAGEVYPDIGICPYVMTGGTDAKYYAPVSKNCIRFAPLYISRQQYKTIHAKNENIYQGTLPMGVDFYKKLIERYGGNDALYRN